MIRTGLLLLLLLSTATPLAAHTRLERSSPAAGDTLHTPPFELRLVFSQAVAPRYTTLVLRGPDGEVIPTPALLPDDTRREYVAMAPHLPLPGRYTIEWRTTSADGHVISGTVEFLLASDRDPRPDSAAETVAAAATPSDTDALHEHHVDQSLLPPLLRPASWPNALARMLQFAAIIALLGLAAFRTLLLPRIDANADTRASLRRGLRTFGAAALTAFLLALPARLWLQSAALHGPDLALERGLLGSLLLDLTWGRAWLAQLTAAAFACIGVIAAFTPALVAGALALAATPAFQGHAAAVEGAPALAIAADALHVAAAGTWVGALAVLLLVAVPALWRHGGDARASHIHALVQRFSPLALAAAAVLVLSGLASALLHIHSPAALFLTTYGRTLLLKLFFVSVVLAAGWYNWKRARPRLGEEEGVAALRRAATLELALAGATLAATAVLVALPTP